MTPAAIALVVAILSFLGGGGLLLTYAKIVAHLTTMKNDISQMKKDGEETRVLVRNYPVLEFRMSVVEKELGIIKQDIAHDAEE
jgi:hypothetical protein